jgi:anti-sigma B factor antagonist
MEIATSRQGPIVVLTLSGNLTAGGAEFALPETVTGLVDDGHNLIVIDLGEVKYVDSAGLGALIRCYKRCTTAGGELRLAGVSARLRTLLELARLGDLFAIFDDVTEAVAARDE